MKKIHLNETELAALVPKILQKSKEYKSRNMDSMGRTNGDPEHYYDDDIVRTVSGELTDQITVYPLIGDFIRSMGGILKRKEIEPKEFVKIALEKLDQEHLTRKEVAELVKIVPVDGNLVTPFMNGGPLGENWDLSTNGFYDWIDKSKESILGVELGFKADDYGLEVANKLIQKKKSNPDMVIRILIDGFVSILMQKLPKSLTQFEQNTFTMISEMRKVGIDVIVNTSFNPLSDDFLAANHIKLWVFDGQAAFFGGIGIESQFRTIMFDEMDLVQGPFVQVLCLIVLLLMKNQKVDYIESNGKTHNLTRKEILRLFVKDTPKQGNMTMRLSMDVPGYIQDAHNDYVELLARKDVSEVFILVPYFSDHKVARSLVKTATRLFNKLAAEKETQIKSKSSNLSNSQIRDLVTQELAKEKKIHVVFPKKQENAIIADVSKYYAYYLRNNPIVETRQFFAQIDKTQYQMLHAKQMVLILDDGDKNWKKYVKFGGSYNPAGRAQNMWEVNAITFDKKWDENDGVQTSAVESPVKEYLDDVMKMVVDKYTEPFVWGTANVKLSMMDKFAMNIARLLWF